MYYYHTSTPVDVPGNEGPVGTSLPQAASFSSLVKVFLTGFCHLSLRYSRRPSLPDSRPKPLSL